MPSQEDIEAQQELLAAHHLTLTIFLVFPEPARLRSHAWWQHTCTFHLTKDVGW
jgi:hypothetical protein